nr:GNAT family N-acetyltransferase [Oceanococcus sp. HetDA_MAG_MS8]
MAHSSAAEALPKFRVSLAQTPADVIEAQQLRYRIFAEEMGADIDGGELGIDADNLDRYCDHLIVRNDQDRIVACTRLLTGEQADMAGGFYSEHEFAIESIKMLVGAKLEVGRTCVDAAYRSGATIATLWSGLADYVAKNNIDYLFGCASIGLDNTAEALDILQSINERYLSAPDLRVQSRKTYPQAPQAAATKSRMPPLLKAYVSLGARACGEAYWDEEFHCVDVFMLLNIKELHPRYRRRFLGPRLAG